MKKKFFIGLFIAAAIGLFIFAYVVLKHKDKEAYIPQQNLQAPIEIPSNNINIGFDNTVNDDKPSVLLFYVDWCSYCRRFMPIFGEFANQYKDKYNFIVINCDKPENTEIVKQYHIMGFPSLFMFDKKINHKFTFNIAATAQKEVFEEELDNYLAVRKNFVVK